MNHFFKNLESIGVIPVVSIQNIEDCIPIAENLIKNNINVIEITLRSDAAIDAIKKIKTTFPTMIVGVGTLIHKNQIDLVKEYVDFIVTPGVDIETIQYAQQLSIPIIPGIDNATSLQKVINLGINIVKFFPAEASGGIKKIKALAAPFKNVKFMPTGGIHLQNINDYLNEDCILAVGGSFFIKKDQKDYSYLDQICKQTIQKIIQATIDFNSNEIKMTSKNFNRFKHYFPHSTLNVKEVQ